MNCRRTGVAALAALLLGAMIPSTSDAKACEWTMYGHDLGRSFASSCTDISPTNVATLRPKWFVNTNAPVTAQPAVYDGSIYVGAYDGTFYAVDATTGAVRWHRSIDDANQTDYGKIVSSAAVEEVDGTTLVVFGGGSTVYVYDDAGTLLASECLDPRSDPNVRCKGSDSTIEIESSPAIVRMPDGEVRVVIGMDFNESPDVGRAGVVALRVDHTGAAWDLAPLWKFDPETLETYTVDPLTSGGAGAGCGNVWSSPAIDVAKNLVFFGVGNCDELPDVPEPGDGESIDAIRLDTGALVWRYAPRAADNGLDLDFGASAQLLPGDRVGEGGKDGFYYALPEEPGTPAPQPSWKSDAAIGSDIGGMIGSSALGKAGDKDAIFATTAIPFSTRDPQSSFEELFSSPNKAFALHAIDATTGDVLWDAPIPLPSYAAAVYANGVVFLADTFGMSIQAYDANLGVPLWAAPLNGAPSSGPAVAGDSIYLGAGTNAPPVPLGSVGGIWAFQLATSVLPY